VEISHLLFADNALTMCDANSDQIYNLGHILQCFKAISGLKVNLRKSKLVAVGEVPYKEKLANILSCSISSLPVKYLGLPRVAPDISNSALPNIITSVRHSMYTGSIQKTPPSN
jgi:hypothetical protein